MLVRRKRGDGAFYLRSMDQCIALEFFLAAHILSCLLFRAYFSILQIHIASAVNLIGFLARARKIVRIVEETRVYLCSSMLPNTLLKWIRGYSIYVNPGSSDLTRAIPATSIAAFAFTLPRYTHENLYITPIGCSKKRVSSEHNGGQDHDESVQIMSILDWSKS